MNLLQSSRLALLFFFFSEIDRFSVASSAQLRNEELIQDVLAAPHFLLRQRRFFFLLLFFGCELGSARGRSTEWNSVYEHRMGGGKGGVVDLKLFLGTTIDDLLPYLKATVGEIFGRISE